MVKHRIHLVLFTNRIIVWGSHIVGFIRRSAWWFRLPEEYETGNHHPKYGGQLKNITKKL
jgi:hypothetical protein